MAESSLARSREAHVVARAVNERRVSAREVAAHSLEVAKAVNGSLNLFTCLFEQEAMRAAELVDARVAAGERPPLAGVTVAVKDNLCTGPDLRIRGDGLGYGGFTTCASRMLETYRSPFTATTVQRLIDAGAVIVGKTNMDEFGMGSSTERSIFGPSRNPHDPARVCGGSSGGSAGAVAAGAAIVALGSDTGGSIRQPASHCGVVGIKPTYGRASRHGLVAYASSLDQVGVMASSVADAALTLQAICGVDPDDGTTAETPVADWFAACNAPAAATLRLGVPAQAWATGNDPEVTRLFRETTERLRSRGVELVEVSLPGMDDAVAAYYIIAAAEASSNLARVDGIRYGRRAGGVTTLDSLYERSRSEGFGEEVQRRIMLGTHVLSSGYYDAYYTTASKVRRKILNEFTSVFTREGCAAVLMPASPGPAFKLGEKTSDPMAMYLEDVYTVAVNLAGLPAITIPAGKAAGGLPVGVQLVGAAFDETRLLQAATMASAACH